MASSLRHRHPHRNSSPPPPTSPFLSSASDSSHSVQAPERPSSRPRSYSMRQISSRQTPSFISLAYPSSLLESLDLPRFWSLRDLLLGKLDEAEEDVKRLMEYSETEDGTSEETEDDDEDWEVVTRRKRGGKRAASASASLADVGSKVPPTIDELNEELSTLDHFTKAAAEFLSALRAELPSLAAFPTSSNDPSTPLVDWQLSPEARIALDKFLDDHPLPTFPALDLRARIGDSKQRASDSATALRARVSIELATLRDLLAQLNNSGTVYSYLPSPSVPTRVAELRDYFAAESAKLSEALHSLSDEASGSLHAGIAHLQDGAHELSAFVTEKSNQAIDEATRMYHAALEGGRQRLLRYEELPHAWRNNPHIISGYRFTAIERWGALLKSAFEWHNETINIQSHLIGFLSLVFLLIFHFPGSPHSLPSSHPADTAIALLFIGAAMKCLLCSAAWHLLAGCATGHWHRGAACVDYVGISGLIAASVMGISYYGFYCKPQVASAYMVFSAVCGVVGMILPWKPWFNDREFKMWRIAFFLGLAGSALTPLAHLAYLYGLSNTVYFFYPVGLSALAYLVGLAFYAQQFPECSAPGRWDNLLASHQLWHSEFRRPSPRPSPLSSLLPRASS
ncbi:hemolysin-III related-domain-containing protein [Leucosporidium creatinivorum]|uniref:Hemolysin-III related-domain-containing protein n=1 Tax=Leucosporidium creatinivorum TaxID=106004 RepID=A0A1Y2CKR5_9BASI|nr:hemolysin-III related-domain-containing protein [Leucosporidium creatinivorum]